MRALIVKLLRKFLGPTADEIAGDADEARWSNWKLASVGFAAAWRGVRSTSSEFEVRSSKLSGIAIDLKYAVRSLRKAPMYAATVVGVIALGMSLATTVFAVVDGVLFKPLPYPRVNELMSVEATRAAVNGTFSVSPSELYAWQSAVPEGQFAAFAVGRSIYVDEGEPAQMADVSENFLSVLGQPPLIGGFDSSPRAAGIPTPVLVAYRTWQRRFGGDPQVIGRVIRERANSSIQIVGILAPDFQFPDTNGRFAPEFLRPLVPARDPVNNRGRMFRVVARLPPELPVSVAQQRLQVATLDLAKRFPGEPGKAWTRPFDGVRVQPVDISLRSAARESFSLVFIAAAALVLLACLNVTSLAAARVQDRRREITLRRALGGTGADLVRLLGAESIVIVSLGTALGLGLAVLMLRVTASLLPDSLVLLRPLAIDARVFAFAVIASALSVAITTLWPARVSLNATLQPALTESGRSFTGQRGRHGKTSRFVLIGTQVALALVMAVVGALVAGSLARLWSEDPGYRVDNTIVLTLTERDSDPGHDVADRLVDDVRRAPGVLAAAGSNQWLLQRAIRGSAFDKPAGVVETGDVESVAVTAGFLETTGLRIVAGRAPTAEEFAAGSRVAVVSEIVAKEYWPAAPAIGQMLLREGVPYSVIGVVPDARYVAFDREAEGNIYYPHRADPQSSIATVFARLDPNRRDAMGSVVALIRTRYAMFRVRDAQYLSATLGKSVRNRQFQAALFSAFGVAGVIIAGVGVLALVAIVTSRRTKEVGVRMALGARPSEIARLVVRQELGAVVAGLLAGGLASFWIVRLIRVYMYKTSVYDPAVWAAAVTLLIVVSATGALIPALRASRTDPVKALRTE
jgi:putative ABC transport system permease protein